MSDASRYDDEIVISWPELHRDARYLSQQLHDRGSWKGIVAITRGGLVPAALVARELEIRLIDTICVSSYGAGAAGGAAQQQTGLQVLKGSVSGDGDGFLLIDDLVDTGQTAQVVRQLLPKAYFATLYAKPAGRPFVDTCVKEFKQNKFPKEIYEVHMFALRARDPSQACPRVGSSLLSPVLRSRCRDSGSGLDEKGKI